MVSNTSSKPLASLDKSGIIVSAIVGNARGRMTKGHELLLQILIITGKLVFLNNVFKT